MAAESSRSSSSGADSYIGSLISLTSKSEIRYEGILYNINTEESSIGLRNVRSFGTEGRKKDGPQVGPSDKVYEYILFRGSDIKDLQVKSSPPAQSTPAPPINSDPAIIQSHYPRPATTTSSLPAAATTGSLADTSSHNSQLGHPGSTFQSGLPLYQPGGNLGSWGPSPPPNANGSGLAMPMYWPGYYGPPSGLPQMHQQAMLRPPTGMSVPPPSMQQPLQYPGFTASLPAGASNLPPPNLPTSNLSTSNFPFSNMPTSNLPEYPSSLLPATASSSVLTSASYPSSSLPSSLPPLPLLGLPSETLPSLTTNKAPNTVGPTVPLGGSLPSLSPLATSTPDINAIAPPISNKSNVISSPSLSYQGISHPVSSVVGTSANQTESPTHSLITPGQLLHSGQGAVPSYQSSQVAHKDVEVVHVAPMPVSEPSAPATVPTEARPPILPTPSRPAQKMNGAPYQNRNNYRGRERGRGSGPSHPVMKFTEEFDFTAMNEKFNKDEVWGHLGKSNKSNSKDKGDGDVTDEEEYEDEDDSELSKVDTKPVYSKDDFFDTLSCNALDNQLNNGRPRFSEQMKLDTETFGEFSRYRGGRGGRGPYRGGGGRGPYRGGGYYRGGGGGYGYNGRGRGGRTPNREY